MSVEHSSPDSTSAVTEPVPPAPQLSRVQRAVGAGLGLSLGALLGGAIAVLMHQAWMFPVIALALIGFAAGLRWGPRVVPALLDAFFTNA